MPKAIRILIYEGSQGWLKSTLEKSIGVGNPMGLPNKASIRELYRRTFDEGEEPEIITTRLKKITLKPHTVTFVIHEEAEDGKFSWKEKKK